ncbi:MAG TPA: 2TM domain-containing protein [Streptosporangiaceae bacterium]
MTLNDTTTTGVSAPTGTEDAALRERAVKRLRKRRDFYGHLLVYTLVNSFLVIIWALTDVHGFFWPVFPIVGWGIGVVLNAWDVFRRDVFTESQISKEIGHLQGR